MITLSASSLSLFAECPKCFWLAMVKKLRRPPSIFPSLPSGMDNVLKGYFDGYRSATTLPVEIAGKVKGRLVPDQTLMDSWRNWRTGLKIDFPEIGVTLRGALDDCLTDGYTYAPLDFKTKGFEPDNALPVQYQRQLDIYALLLDRSGYKSSGEGHLVYFYPKSLTDGARVPFGCIVHTVATNIVRAESFLTSAANLLKGAIPLSSEKCGFCEWHENRIRTRVA